MHHLRVRRAALASTAQLQGSPLIPATAHRALIQEHHRHCVHLARLELTTPTLPSPIAHSVMPDSTIRVLGARLRPTAPFALWDHTMPLQAPHLSHIVSYVLMEQAPSSPTAAVQRPASRALQEFVLRQ
jgi:hypothetical protein